MSVSIDSMKESLITADEVLESLGTFEPFEVEVVDRGSSLTFNLEPDWNLNYDTLAPTDTVAVTVTGDEDPYPLTKEALAGLSVDAGLPVATLKKAPYDAVQGFLNRVYRSTTKDVKVLSVDGVLSAVAPATITPYSSVRLAENVIEAIQTRYGSDAEIYADYKFQNTLNRTDVRFIVPDEARRFRHTDMADVPHGQHDDWSAGVHLSNSLTGKTQTFVDAYLFRWWCTNGATERNTSVGTWDRRRQSDDDSDVYAWAAHAVDEAMAGMDERFDQIEALTQIEVRDANSVVGEVFSQYNLPARQRQRILSTLVGSGDLTLYKVMQAVTEAANEDGLAEKDVERLLRIGGNLYSNVTLDPQKARIWDAGHFAPSGAPNPFSLRSA